MGTRILGIHWKSARWYMLPVLVAAFGLPLMAGRAAWGRSWTVEGLESVSSWSLIGETAAFSLTFPILAMVTGAVVALTAWSWDHRSGHVYPLSLPIARWRYATLKFASGVILLAGTSALFLTGAGISSTLANLPVGLRSYPVGLTTHFFLASLTAYALLFALAAGTMRTALLVISGFLLLLFFGNGLADLAGNFHPPLAEYDIPLALFNFLIEGDGPFAIFGGNWMLIDV